MLSKVSGLGGAFPTDLSAPCVSCRLLPGIDVGTW